LSVQLLLILSQLSVFTNCLLFPSFVCFYMMSSWINVAKLQQRHSTPFTCVSFLRPPPSLSPSPSAADRTQHGWSPRPDSSCLLLRPQALPGHIRHSLHRYHRPCPALGGLYVLDTSHQMEQLKGSATPPSAPLSSTQPYLTSPTFSYHSSDLCHIHTISPSPSASLCRQ
jgi:hypothetical protein